VNAIAFLALGVVLLAGWIAIRFLGVKRTDYLACMAALLVAALVVAITVAGVYQLACLATQRIQDELKEKPLKVDAKVEFGPDSLKGLSDWGKK